MGFLQVDYWPFRSFDVFEKLEVIHGQHSLFHNIVALFLASSRPSSGEAESGPEVEEFGLKSLRSIENGNVAIMGHEFTNACHLQTIKWERFIKRPIENAKFQNGYFVQRKGDGSILDHIRENQACQRFQCDQQARATCFLTNTFTCLFFYSVSSILCAIGR